MKILIIADELQKLRPAADTGLALLRAALVRGHEVYWALSPDLFLLNQKVSVTANEILSCAEDELPQTSKRAVLPVSTFDSVWIRKDPPFDAEYLSLCWLLSLEEKPYIMNNPRHLVQYHEKLLPFLGVRMGFLQPDDLVPTLVTGVGTEHPAPKDFSAGESIVKPWFGFGGNAVEKFATLSEALETATQKQERMMVQSFIPEVMKSGDRRSFFLGGKYIDSVVRVPKPGGFISNLVQGGSGSYNPLTAREQALCGRLEKFLTHLGIAFAGSDFLNERVSEINITAPTGVQPIKRLGGADIATLYVEWVEKQVKAKK